MTEKNFSMIKDEDGYVILTIAGRDFVSTEPLQMVAGKFKVDDIENLVFVEGLMSV